MFTPKLKVQVNVYFTVPGEGASRTEQAEPDTAQNATMYSMSILEFLPTMNQLGERVNCSSKELTSTGCP